MQGHRRSESESNGLQFFHGINDSGQIAFKASLADGSEGIFRTDADSMNQQPIPEPTSLTIWSLLGLGAAGYGLRRW